MEITSMDDLKEDGTYYLIDITTNKFKFRDRYTPREIIADTSLGLVKYSIYTVLIVGVVLFGISSGILGFFNSSSAPKDYTIPSNLDYLHFTSNNTIYGTQYKQFPQTDLPLVCDMSSDIFSQVIDVSKFDLIYAGAQKNLGPAGATIYIVKDSALGKSTSPFMPSYLDLKQQVDKESMLNTPPVFSVYVALLNLRNLLENGGVSEMEKRNIAKATLLYNEIDRNTLFTGSVKTEDRSNMNITFTLNDESNSSAFDSAWKAAGIVGLPGHRSVGGYRASIYNALPIESVQVLVDVMKHFESQG